jgi:hypothetical protein
MLSPNFSGNALLQSSSPLQSSLPIDRYDHKPFFLFASNKQFLFNFFLKPFFGEDTFWFLIKSFQNMKTS